MSVALFNFGPNICGRFVAYNSFSSFLQQDSSLGSFEGDPVVSEESLTDVETSHRRTKATSTTSQTQTRKVQEAISRHQSKPNSVSAFSICSD